MKRSGCKLFRAKRNAEREILVSSVCDGISGFIKDYSVMREYERLSRESVGAGVTDEMYCDKKVIVSLTSYGNRIHDLYLVIESIMQQTVKPNMIVLWLDENKFTVSSLPVKLRRLMKRGLTVEFCRDIGSYTKLVPALRRFPDDIIITVDDDVLYHDEMLEHLLASYNSMPEAIHFCRGHRMVKNEDGTISKYTDWEFCIEDTTPDKLNFPTGIGGVLYPPHSLHEDVGDEKIFQELAPMADDVWFKAMAMRRGTISKKVFTRDPKGEDHTDMSDALHQDTALHHVNIGQGHNNAQIEAVFSRYGLYDLL